MKITQEADYALRIVNFLSDTGERVTGASTIAQKQAIPLRFALKILRKLNGAGLTQATRGVNGGYRLAKSPAAISYLEVIEAIDGPVLLNRCTQEGAVCSRDAREDCPMHKNLQRIRQNLCQELRQAHFGLSQEGESKPIK